MLTFIAYSGALGFPFVYDDHAQIVENAFVHSWRFLPRYFTQHVWAAVQPELLGNYYRPVFLLWLRLNDAVFGLKPWGWHFSSLLVHLGVTLLTYVLSVRIVHDRLTAALAAMIFGVHPVHVEAVAWISGVTEPLQGALFIVSFLCYLETRQRKEHAQAWLAASLASYSAALLVKETSLVLPLVIFAYEWILGGNPAPLAPPRRPFQRISPASRRVLPYVAVVALYLAARAHALKGVAHTVTPLRLTTIVCTWPVLLCSYLRVLVWPVGLAPYYDLPYVTRPGLLNFVLPAAAIIALGLVLWAWGRKASRRELPAGQQAKSRVLAFAAAWLFAPTLPLLNLSVFPKGDFAHDRYLYLPSVGFAIMGGLLLREIQVGRVRWLGQPAAQIITALVLGCAGAGATTAQSLVWADDIVLYSRALKVVPDNSFVRTDLGTIMAGRGYYGSAIKLYEQVLARDPAFWLANYQLGYTYFRVGKFDEAEEYLNRAIAISSTRPDPFLYLGLTRLESGRLGGAAEALQQAIRIRPEGEGYHLALGTVLELQGDFAGALEAFRRELALNPKQQAAQDKISQIETGLRSLGPEPSSPTTPSGREKK